MNMPSPCKITGFSFVKIMVADVAAMERFYCDALGLTVRTRIAVDRPDYAIRETILEIGGGETLLNLVQHLDRPCPAAGEAMLGLAVQDIDAVIALAVSAGATILQPVTPIPDHHVKVAFLADPEGHQIELLEYSSAI
jgi:catechol 2,3-dioxygenase-like lactoylglutathione lyase family enzyme